jgi:hypothetical protein
MSIVFPFVYDVRMLTPILRLDKRERWKPVDVERSLGVHGYDWNGGWTNKDGKIVSRIDLPSSMKPDDFAMLSPTGYHRVAKGGGLHWHQFWTWWPYNPKKYAGYGEHEGDWEMIQLGCLDEAGDEPVLMTCSQHDGGEKREYWRVTIDENKQPIVYVARDSHANYFEPMRDVTDQADGAGAHLALEWHDFPAWALWPGQWGNSANSPGPLAVRRAWKAPHAYHGQCR